MGGANWAFMATQWTLVRQAGNDGEQRSPDALERLISCYWKPIYCYLRRKGHDDARAKDLTQGFFQEAILGRDLVETADPAKGRFRVYLLSALRNYVTSTHRKAVAKKRGSGQRGISLDSIDGQKIPVPVAGASPEDAFALAWASDLLDRVLVALEEECRQDSLSTHWELFCSRVLRPITEGGTPTPLPELCRTFGIQTEAKVSNMVVTVKRRFRVLFRSLLRQYVATEEDLDQEIQEIMAILSKTRAGRQHVATGRPAGKSNG